MLTGDIIKQFMFDGEFAGAEQLTTGHINDTFIVSFLNKDTGGRHRYVLQRVNRNVFREPEKVMENIENVTLHLRKKIEINGGDPRRETLNIIPSVGGRSYYVSEDGDYWRAYTFIENARTYNAATSPAHMYSAGKAVGKFHVLLDDFPIQELHETIPQFHDTRKRFDDFAAAVERDAVNRAWTAAKEINFVEKRVEEIPVLVDLLKEGSLPLRVIHNDTKFNNVLIDNETGEGICLVDLDTVMPGLSLYDFGDAVRFGVNTAGEDERDLSLVNMNMHYYEQFCRGYMEATGNFLTPLEVECLPFAAKLITLECGMRFLTDYVNGDVYFKTQRESHNIDRACTQFKLVEDMESRFDRMKKIVDKYRV